MAFINPQSVGTAEALSLEHKDFTPNDSQTSGDHFAHAVGRICARCDRPIEVRQPARRRGESGWAHDVCPDAD
jgi:hypothetical protein